MGPVAEIVDPGVLSDAEREALIDELYATHCRIFSGVSREAFAGYVVDSPATRTRIQVLRRAGDVVGYSAFHAFDTKLQGKRCMVLRTEVGLLPEFRRGTRMGGFLLRETLRIIARYPRHEVIGLSCATNPATYRSLVRHCAQIWPSPHRTTPEPMAALMGSLAEAFALVPVAGAADGVYEVGWKTLQDDGERRAWEQTQDPASRFYLERNPGYVRGNGMMIVVPLNALSIVRSFTRMVVHRIGRRWRRWRSARPSGVILEPSA